MTYNVFKLAREFYENIIYIKTLTKKKEAYVVPIQYVV